MIAPARLLLHPILLNRRSRSLLFWYLLSAIAVTVILWWRAGQLAQQAGITIADASLGAPPLGRFLVMPHVIGIIVIFSALLATGLTAISIVGPIRRIEEWLNAWEVGLDIRAMKVRRGDPYETMMRLLNELYMKSARAKLVGRRLRGPLAEHRPSDSHPS